VSLKTLPFNRFRAKLRTQFLQPAGSTRRKLHLNQFEGETVLRGLFRTKNLDDILAHLGDEKRTLKRTLGPLNVTLLGIGAIIGAGIFATVGTAQRVIRRVPEPVHR